MGHHHGHGHDHGHEHDEPAAAAAGKDDASSVRSGGSPKVRRRKAAAKPEASAPAPAPAAPAEVATSSSERAVGGYLNLAADAAHNFTDGLMLGAAFLPMESGPQATWRRGVATTIAVLVHEVPHEVGDVAVLMQAGWGKWAAIRTQLLTALGAALGAVVGVMTGETKADLLLNFTAGGFIYVATVDVLPQLLRECSAWQSVKEILAMCAGIGLMLVVMAFE